MSRRILVTGGFGFIGANFIRHLLLMRPSWKITNLDALTYSGNPDNLAGLPSERLRNVIGCVTDSRLVDREVAEADLIVHFAAESHVDRAIDNSTPFIKTNIEGTQCLLEAIRKHPGRRLVQVSTDEVYGSLPLDDPESSFSETSPLVPNNPYAASKAAADMLARAHHNTFGVDVVITRASNNFGPWQFPEKIIPLFVTNLVLGRKVPIYGDGLNSRDWVHVEDHCAAILLAAEHGKPGAIYNVGADNECSNLNLTRILLALFGKSEDEIAWRPDRRGHDRRYAVDSSRIRRELGWRPRHSSWPDALRDTVNWYIANESWWRRIISGEYHQAQNLLRRAA